MRPCIMFWTTEGLALATVFGLWQCLRVCAQSSQLRVKLGSSSMERSFKFITQELGRNSIPPKNVLSVGLGIPSTITCRLRTAAASGKTFLPNTNGNVRTPPGVGKTGG